MALYRQKILLLLPALVVGALLCGCNYSPAPVAANHEAYLQLRIQASEHWRDMASEIADRVVLAVLDRQDVRARSIHVAMPARNDFSLVFYNLLRTELVSRGLQITERRESRGILLEYEVQLVAFDQSRFQDQPLYLGDRYAENANTEVVVTARLATLNRYFMHCSVIRYINDADYHLYRTLRPEDLPPPSRNRSIRVVNR
ncbi:hypothetical protein LJC36_06405 [Desulfovibrio sp. OttesenSCG-928-C14]|nr:hypothetical protein [Desulfovibrio sp. OttesenSCG-928-C14]